MGAFGMPLACLWQGKQKLITWWQDIGKYVYYTSKNKKKILINIIYIKPLFVENNLI